MRWGGVLLDCSPRFTGGGLVFGGVLCPPPLVEPVVEPEVRFCVPFPMSCPVATDANMVAHATKKLIDRQ